MKDTLERDTGETPSGPNSWRRGGGRIAFAGDGVTIAAPRPPVPEDHQGFKARLREELVLQALARLPITYAELAERVTGSGGTGAIRDALGQLMEDDAGEGRPLLAAVAVNAHDPGLPAPWFFRKAESIGLFAGDPDDVEAYAFHAKEFHRAIRFHAPPSHHGRALQVLPPAGRVREHEILIAKDIMTSPVIAVGPDSTVGEVAGLMVSHAISAVPVIGQGALLGIVSEGDLIRRAEIGTAARRRSWWFRLFVDNAALAADYVRSHSVHVTDVMTRKVVIVAEDTPVADIAGLLERHRIKRVPVMRDGRVMGIVSRANLVQALAAASKSLFVPAAHGDSDIRLEILDALRSESWPSARDQDVTVIDGVVVFRGAYLSEQERKASHILAENITGVRAIDDHRVHLDMTSGIV